MQTSEKDRDPRPRGSGRRLTVLSAMGLMLLLSAPRAGAGPVDPWQKVKEGARGIKTLQARFVQEKRLAILVKPLISTGSFAFEAPSSVRWEYDKPVRTISLVHQGKVQRYTRSSEGKLVKDAASGVEAMRAVLEQISGWFAGRFDSDGVFEARLLEGARPVARLVPRVVEMKRFIQYVEIHFAEQPGVVSEVHIVESERASTVIRFTDVKVNAELPSRLFTEVK